MYITLQTILFVMVVYWMCWFQIDAGKCPDPVACQGVHHRAEACLSLTQSTAARSCVTFNDVLGCIAFDAASALFTMHQVAQSAAVVLANSLELCRLLMLYGRTGRYTRMQGLTDKQHEHLAL